MERNIERDLKYIDQEIVAKQANGKYCKWSVLANTVTVMDFTPEDYLNYWLRTFKGRGLVQRIIITKEDMKEIKERISKVFERAVPLEEMIRRVELSNETEKEQKRIKKTLKRV